MIEIPALEAYSAGELKSFAAYSPAGQRYLQLLQLPAKTPEQQLKLERHRAWLRSALATYHGSSSIEDICKFWSAQTDVIVKKAWQLIQGNSDIGIFALGKWGAEELNLSSDIDLILVQENPSDKFSTIPAKLIRLLQTSDEYGFCFRLDFDLRPGGGSSPIVSNLSAFENHYGNLGETWERLALVRLRPLLGPKKLIDQVQELANKFTYRRFLDYTLIEAFKNLRSQIQTEYFSPDPNRFDLKLSLGGIRDIELYVHSLQVIHGGKIKQIRTNSTSLALQNLIQHQLLPASESQFLNKTYWWYRHLENLVQCREDRQTHVLDYSTFKSSPKFAFQQDEIKANSTHVDKIVAELLGVFKKIEAKIPKDEADQKRWLTDSGFSENTITQIWPQLMAATALSQNRQQDEIARQAFLYNFIRALQTNSLDRDLGLSLLLDFVKSTRAKATFFTLFLKEPQLVIDLAKLFSSSPYWGGVLASRPELVDGFLLKKEPEYSEEFPTLLEELVERRLLNELSACTHFLVHRDITLFCQTLSENADFICRLILQRLQKEFTAANMNILTMGKWASRELGIKSDLDFVFMTEDVPSEMDQRLARKFVYALTQPVRGGPLYNIDLRLRPSGNAGPILIQKKNIIEYLRRDAAAWERQAYLRSRILIQNDNDIRSASTNRELSRDEIAQLADIKNKLLKQDSEDINLKFARGGLVDIEFVLQTALLKLQKTGSDCSVVSMLLDLEASDVQWKQLGPKIRESYLYSRTLEQLQKIVGNFATPKLSLQSEAFSRLAKLLDSNPESLFKKIQTSLANTSTLLKDLDPVGIER